MEEFKGTKGIWAANSVNEVYLIGDEYVPIANNINGINKKECIANAKLIAAAPELLEALKQMIDIAPIFNLSESGLDKIRNAKQAINKALNG